MSDVPKDGSYVPESNPADQRPREWWIRTVRERLTGDRGFLAPLNEVASGPLIEGEWIQMHGHGNGFQSTGDVHVIEHSAYLAVCAERDEAKRIEKEARSMYAELRRDVTDIVHERDTLRAENEFWTKESKQWSDENEKLRAQLAAARADWQKEHTAKVDAKHERDAALERAEGAERDRDRFEYLYKELSGGL